jgi:hypothetical protein
MIAIEILSFQSILPIQRGLANISPNTYSTDTGLTRTINRQSYPDVEHRTDEAALDSIHASRKLARSLSCVLACHNHCV